MKEIRLKVARGIGGKHKKVGAVLVVGADISKRDATYMVDRSFAEVVGEKEATKEPVKEPEQNEATELKDLKVAELKKIADDAELEYPAKATKADLVKLIEENTEPFTNGDGDE